MSTIKLTILGKPIPKKRPRFVRKGNFVGTYSAQKKEERDVKTIIKSQLKGIKPISIAVHFKAIFFMPIPKGTSKKKVARMMNGELLHTKKPDVDNLEKFICDCLNGLVWEDDSQVVWSDTKKLYSDNPKTELTITKLKELT